MNLRTNAIQLILVTATAASSASAFVLPFSTFRPSTIAISPTGTSIASRPNLPTSLGLVGFKTAELLKDLDGLGADVEGAKSDDGESAIKLLQKLADVLEHLDSPDSTYLKDEPLTEAPVSRKAVLMATPDVSETDIADLKAAEPDEETSTFSGVMKIIRSLIEAYAEEAITGEIAYTTYPRHPEFPDVDLSSMMKMMDGAPPPEYIFSARKIRRLIQRVLALSTGLQSTKLKVNRASAENMFEEFFTDFTSLVPKPKHNLKNWENDKELARQMICGVNPVMIEVAKDLAQLSDNIAEHFGAKELQGLIDEKRLFFVSYDAIEELKVNPHQGSPVVQNPSSSEDDPRNFYAPIAVFALDEKREELDIMGIQLERKSDSKVYTPIDGNDWLFAKIHLSSTDSNIHEWVSHLGKTHLTMEPHILAIHNTLKKKGHKLYTFLEPLCKDTLLLNWAARKTLADYGADSIGDTLSSIGVGQYMQINRNWWSTYNFFESSGLPSELASRGFDEDFDMPPYLFREDGMRLWNAYGGFATDFVDELYKSDADIYNDEDVQAWAKETSAFDRAAVPGFPAAITDKTTLVKILQTLMWIPGGLHAAVNFPQYDFYAYAPNKPLHMRAKLPISSREDIFENALPVKENVELTILLTRVLTLPSETCIDNIKGNFAKVGKDSYSEFQSKLDEIGDDIEKRNKKSKKAGKAIYSYLNPSVVPASIDI